MENFNIEEAVEYLNDLVYVASAFNKNLQVTLKETPTNNFISLEDEDTSEVAMVITEQTDGMKEVAKRLKDQSWFDIKEEFLINNNEAISIEDRLNIGDDGE